MVAGVVLARALGPSGRGEVAAQILWGSIAFDVGALGTPHAVAYFVGSAARPPEQDSTLRITRRLYPLMGGIGIVLFALMAVASRSTVDSDAFVVTGLWILGLLAAAPLVRFSQGTGRMRAFNIGRIIGEASPVIGIAMLALVGWTAASSVMGVYTVSVAVAIVYLWIRVGIGSVLKEALRPSRPIRSAFWKYSLWNLFAIGALKLNRAVDILILSLATDPSTVGTYAVAASVAAAIAIVGASLGLDLFPKLVRRESHRRSLINRYLLWNSAAALVAIAGIVLLAPVLVPLVYGEAFTASVAPTRILAVGSFGLATSQVTSEALKALGRPRVVAITQLIGGSATVLGIVAVGTASLSGVAASSAIGYLVTAGLQYLFVLKHTSK